MPKGEHRTHMVRNSPERIEELVTKNISLVFFAVNKLSHIPLHHYDDAIGEAMVVLVKCARSFDESRQLKFSTYVVRSIQFLLSRSKWEFTLKIKRNTYGFTSYPEGGMIDEPSYEQEFKIDSDDPDLIECLSILPARDRAILLDLQTMTARATAKKYFVCAERIRQIRDRAFAKIRTFLEEGKTCT